MDSTIDFFALLYSTLFFFVCFYPYVNFSYLQKKKIAQMANYCLRHDAEQDGNS